MPLGSDGEYPVPQRCVDDTLRVDATTRMLTATGNKRQ